MVNISECLWQYGGISGIFEVSNQSIQTMYKNYSDTKKRSLTKAPGALKWLEKINEIMKDSLYNPDINNLKMAKALDISERELFRKVKMTTGLSPQKYFRKYRLNKVMELMKKGEFSTVKESGIAIGYSNTSYFIHQFEKEFGMKPLQVLKEFGWR